MANVWHLRPSTQRLKVKCITLGFMFHPLSYSILYSFDLLAKRSCLYSQIVLRDLSIDSAKSILIMMEFGGRNYVLWKNMSFMHKFRVYIVLL